MKCITKYIGLVFLGLLLLACRDKQKPNSEFAPDMYESAAYKTYATPPLTPPEHTVKRGSLPYPYPNTLEGYEQAKANLRADTSLTVDAARGQALYNVYCALCHGEQGDGKGVLVQRGKVFGVPQFAGRDFTEGSIYHVLYYGRNAMPAFATQLTEEERWQIVKQVLLKDEIQKTKDE